MHDDDARQQARGNTSGTYACAPHPTPAPRTRSCGCTTGRTPSAPSLTAATLTSHSQHRRAARIAPAAALTGAAASLLGWAATQRGWAATQRGWGGRGDLAARSQRGPAAARLGVLREMQSGACGPHAPPPAWRVGSACSCRARLPAALSMPAARCAPATAPPPRHDRPCRAGGLQSSQRHAPAAWPNPR